MQTKMGVFLTTAALWRAILSRTCNRTSAMPLSEARSWGQQPIGRGEIPRARGTPNGPGIGVRPGCL